MIELVNLISGTLEHYDYNRRSELLDYYNKIVGIRRTETGVALFEDAYNGNGKGYVVEIGTHRGASLIPLVAGTKMAYREKVIAIDRSTTELQLRILNNPSYEEQSLSMLQALFLNLVICNLRDYVIPILYYSKDVSKILNIPIRLLHVDGGHNGLTAEDLQNYLPMLITDGIIHCHDYTGYTKEIIDQYVNKDNFCNLNVLDNVGKQIPSLRAVKT